MQPKLRLIFIFFLFQSIFCLRFLSDEDIDLITANPGVDSSKSIRISWQSKSSECKLYYTTSDDTSFSSGQKVTVTQSSKSKTTYSGKDSFYKFGYEITSLKSNTKYIYKITCNSVTSEIHKFKTASTDGEFYFAFLGDVHANSGDNAKSNAEKLIKIAENLSDNKIDFVLSQGDLVKYGEKYSDWKQWNNHYVTKNYMLATVPGNKEYYNTDKDLTSEKWFLATFNNPTNGPDGLPAAYWFKYGSVLFIGVDNINENFSYKDTQNWVKSVVSKNEGTYQYLVIFKHYPDFVSSNTEDYSSYGSSYTKWYKIYDEIGADFVLSGDSHEYVRSKLLYDNKESSSSTKGTVYITAPMCAPDNYSTKITSIKNCLLEVGMNSGATHGAGYFKVTQSEITYNEFGGDGKVYDTVTVKAKRTFDGSVIPDDGDNDDSGKKDDEDKEPTGNYSEWSSNNKAYNSGDLVQYQGKVYECISGHNSNAAWTPTDANTLWKLRADLVAKIFKFEILW